MSQRKSQTPKASALSEAKVDRLLGSQPIRINAPKSAKKTKLELAHSCPVNRPPPPRSPTQRPRLPSIDPPPMTLPPSPLTEPPVELVGSEPSDSKAVKIDPAKKKKKKQAVRRSLTIYSSSAPNVSYVAKFLPQLMSRAAGEPDSTAQHLATLSLNGGDQTKQPDSDVVAELVHSVGSPTIFSLLRLETERRNSQTVKSPEEHKKPVTEPSPAAAVVQEPLKVPQKNKGDDDLQFELDVQESGTSECGVAASGEPATLLQ